MIQNKNRQYLKERTDLVEGDVFRFKNNTKNIDYVCSIDEDVCYPFGSENAVALLKKNRINIPCNILNNRIFSPNWVCNNSTGQYVQIKLSEFNDIYNRAFYDKNRWRLISNENNTKLYFKDLKENRQYDLESPHGWKLATDFAVLWNYPSVFSIKKYKMGDEYKLLDTEPHLVYQYLLSNMKKRQENKDTKHNLKDLILKLEVNLDKLDKSYKMLGIETGEFINRLNNQKLKQNEVMNNFKLRLRELNNRYFAENENFIINKVTNTVDVKKNNITPETMSKIQNYKIEYNNLIAKTVDNLLLLIKSTKNLQESLKSRQNEYFKQNILGNNYNNIRYELQNINSHFKNKFQNAFDNLNNDILNKNN